MDAEEGRVHAILRPNPPFFLGLGHRSIPQLLLAPMSMYGRLSSLQPGQRTEEGKLHTG